MRIVTLLTDFGLKDGNVAVMKGVIWQISPETNIVDISHLIQPQNTLEACLILFRSSLFFPSGSIHVFVVDPGVGTKRKPIAVKIGTHFFVGPDNGILTLLLDNAKKQNMYIEGVILNKPNFWLPKISSVFHGRDIFAPIAAHLATGIPIKYLGAPTNNFVRLSVPTPKKTSYGFCGKIIYIDHFGNAVTNIHVSQMKTNNTKISIKLCGISIRGIIRSFAEKSTGDIVALLGGPDHVMISVVNGNAARKIGIRIGTEVKIYVH